MPRCVLCFVKKRKKKRKKEKRKKNDHEMILLTIKMNIFFNFCFE